MKAVSFLAFLARLGVTPEPAQRVFYAVAADGVQPATLKGDDGEIARALFGELDEVPTEARGTVAAIKGGEIGWSYFGGLRLLHRAVTADVSRAAAGEVRRGLVVAPDLRLAREVVAYASGAAESQRELRQLVEDPTSDGFTLRREKGRKVRIEALPATRGGRATRGRRYFEALVDETEFFYDEASGVVNDSDIYRSVVARCKGQVWLGSTPWTGGLLKELFDKNHGAPRTALAASLPTLTMRTDPTVRRAVEQEYERDPENAAREFGCEFLPKGSGQFFDAQAIDRAVDTVPMAVAPHAVFGCGADFGFRSDSSALAIVGFQGGLYHVVELDEVRPEQGAPLQPSIVVGRFVGTAKRHGVGVIMSDWHYSESVRELLSPHGVTLIAAPDKVESYVRFRGLLHEGKVRLPRNPRLISQLRSIVSKPTSGGALTITAPRRAAGGHGDLVSAVVLAVWRAYRQHRGGGDLRVGGYREQGRWTDGR